ncbi:MAG: DUF2203 family protein [Bdellovibrionales bacterium]|nr:DUF2203 family protein [Bdellovibrionales bacterium]
MQDTKPFETEQNVSFLKRPRRFTLAQAQNFVSILDGITFMAMELVTPLMEELKNPLGTQDKQVVTQKVQKIVSMWSEQVLYFGGITRGLWMVDFDCGDGFYTWVYGEKSISSYRTYHQDFSDRTPIS